MDFSSWTSVQPSPYPGTPDQLYRSTPLLQDFDMLQSPTQTTTIPKFFNGQYFNHEDLEFDLLPLVLMSENASTAIEEMRNTSSQITVHAGDTLLQQAQSSTPGTDISILTPSQDRRRLQNRAAQRAFRQRRQLQNKELRVKVRILEQQLTFMADEHARLKQKTAKVTARNMILQAELRVSSIAGMLSKTEREQDRSPPDTPTSYEFR